MPSLPPRPTIAQLSAALAARQVSSRELTAAALARIGATDQALNTFASSAGILLYRLSGDAH